MAKKSERPTRKPEGADNAIGSVGKETGDTSEPREDNGVGSSDNGNDGGNKEAQAQIESFAQSADTVAGPAAPKKRGRPPGSGTKKTTTVKLDIAKSVVNASDLAPKIQGLHVMLAMMTNQPVFNLQPEECQQLAEAIAEVSKHYDINLMSGPRAALINLAVVAGMIYVPRVITLSKRPKSVRGSVPSTPSEVMATAQQPMNYTDNVVGMDGEPRGSMKFE